MWVSQESIILAETGEGETKMTRFSLVVPTVGRTHELERFLASLRTQTHQNFELIVVDQNSDSRLAAVLAAYEDTFPIFYIREKERGASRARNSGLRHPLTGAVVAFPDDDCQYPPDLLDKVARFFASHPQIDGLSGTLIDEHGNLSSFSSAKPGP